MKRTTSNASYTIRNSDGSHSATVVKGLTCYTCHSIGNIIVCDGGRNCDRTYIKISIEITIGIILNNPSSTQIIVKRISNTIYNLSREGVPINRKEKQKNRFKE